MKKTKITLTLVMTVMIIVCVLLTVGIYIRLYGGEGTDSPAVAEISEEVETIVNTEPEILAEEIIEETTEELAIEIEIKTESDANEQKLQPDPIKTEETKPTEAPTLAEGSNLENPAVMPSYEEEAVAPVEQSVSESSVESETPAHGTQKDGMIYLLGFGWVADEGGGGEGIYAEDMYENGNKIGIMD